MNNIEGPSSAAKDDSEKKTSKTKNKKTAGVASFTGAALIQPRTKSAELKKAEALSSWSTKDRARSNDTIRAESKNMSSADTQEASEAEIDRIARITDSEKPIIVSHIAREMAEQPIEANEADAPGVEAGQVFLERVANGEDSDEVRAEMLTALDAEPEALYKPGTAETDQDIDTASVLAETDETMPFGEVPHDAEAGGDIGQEDDGIASGAQTTASPGGTGGSGRTPPPPAPPGGGGRTPGGSPPPPGGPVFGAAPGYNPGRAPANPPVERVEYVDRSNEAGMFFLGGIIGYLIGRRRGRIKTEKKLLPVQKKLEKQVKNLHDQLEEKRLQIHAAAVKKARAEHWSRAEVRQKLQPQKSRSERARVEQRSVAPEANQLHGKKPAPEQIGHMLVGVETSHKPMPEAKKISQQKVEKNIDTLNRAELLALSENIIVEGSNLRQVYETNLIGERGLRRLVREHLRGGDVQKALRREVVEREIDFERDPAERDHPSQNSGDTGSSSATALQELLQQAHNGSDADKEQAALFEARAAYEAEQRTNKQRQRRFVDISVAAIAAILISLIITVYLTRL